MRTIIVSFTTVGLLLIIFFQPDKNTQAELISSAAQVAAQASPTPIKKQAKQTESVPSSAPVCSPTPPPENEKIYPYQEKTLEDFLNSGLGTPDWDCDGICNIRDNCLVVYNPDQKDSDGDGKGDACNPRLVGDSFIDSRCDEDADGVPNLKDNCPRVCNPDQKDANKNGIGDVCDQAFPNPILSSQPCSVQREVKVPVISDARSNDPCGNDPGCDPFGEIYKRYETQDTDGDGVPDFKDNCPLACNLGQKDANKNGIGDVCDQAFPNPVLSFQTCPVRRKVKAPKPPRPAKISTSRESKTSVESNQSNR